MTRTRHSRPHAIAALLCAALLLPAVAGAEWYRYENDEGTVVLDHRIPPEYVHKGYTVLGDDGRVLRVVPRALTPQERAEQDRQEAAAAVARQREAERIARDQELLRLYSSPDDVARARDRKVASIQAYINTTRADIERLRVQKRNLELQAAELERSGRTVTPEIVENIQIIANTLREREAEIAARRDEQDEVREEYARDIERMRRLFELPVQEQAGAR